MFHPSYTNSFVWLYTWSGDSTLNMELDSGIPYVYKHMISVLASHMVRPKFTYTTNHPHHLPQLLGRLRDDSVVVSVKYAPKRRRQDWLSDDCFPPPPFSSSGTSKRPRDLGRLETRVSHVYNCRREEDVEQKERKHACLTKALFHSKPPRAHPVTEPQPCSHAIVDLMTKIILCGTPKQTRTVQRMVRSTESYALIRPIKCRCKRICFFHANSCSRRIMITSVERFGRKLLCSFGRIPTRSQYSLRRRAMVSAMSCRRALSARFPCCCRTLSDPSFL